MDKKITSNNSNENLSKSDRKKLIAFSIPSVLEKFQGKTLGETLCGLPASSICKVLFNNGNGFVGQPQELFKKLSLVLDTKVLKVEQTEFNHFNIDCGGRYKNTPERKMRLHSKNAIINSINNSKNKTFTNNKTLSR